MGNRISANACMQTLQPFLQYCQAPALEGAGKLNLMVWNLLLSSGSESGLAATQARRGFVDGLWNNSLHSRTLYLVQSLQPGVLLGGRSQENRRRLRPPGTKSCCVYV